MTCGDRFNKNCPTGGTRVAPEEADGRPLCDHPGCGKRLQGDGTCVDGHVQGVASRPGTADMGWEDSVLLARQLLTAWRDVGGAELPSITRLTRACGEPPSTVQTREQYFAAVAAARADMEQHYRELAQRQELPYEEAAALMPRGLRELHTLVALPVELGEALQSVGLEQTPFRWETNAESRRELVVGEHEGAAAVRISAGSAARRSVLGPFTVAGWVVAWHEAVRPDLSRVKRERHQPVPPPAVYDSLPDVAEEVALALAAQKLRAVLTTSGAAALSSIVGNGALERQLFVEQLQAHAQTALQAVGLATHIVHQGDSKEWDELAGGPAIWIGAPGDAVGVEIGVETDPRAPQFTVSVPVWDDGGRDYPSGWDVDTLGCASDAASAIQMAVLAIAQERLYQRAEHWATLAEAEAATEADEGGMSAADTAFLDELPLAEDDEPLAPPDEAFLSSLPE